ncbi:MAG: hypothetical protein NT007_07910 [Candidatus Kapabacteria bacterium]|nr:hypothetical protein [Candidatus Kapabacteria bacterium]
MEERRMKAMNEESRHSEFCIINSALNNSLLKSWTNPTVSTGSRTKFLEKEKDAESGDCNLGVRQYGDNIGRFFCPDKMWEKYYSLSPYAYCGNNPVMGSDPSGYYATVVNGVVNSQFNGSSLPVYSDINSIALATQLNSYIRVWSDPNNRQFAPNVAQFLIENAIPVYYEDRRNPATDGGIIAIPIADIKGSKGYWMEADFFHELIHNMKGANGTYNGEFQAYGAEFAAGYLTKDKVLEYFRTNWGNIRDNMDSKFNKYFDKNGNLINGMETKFLNDYYKVGKEIIGNVK